MDCVDRVGGQAQLHLVSIRWTMNVMYNPFDGHCIIRICEVTWFSFRLAVETKQLTPCLPFPVDRVGDDADSSRIL